jgi:probable F420-dependent oxidoreductase
MKIGTFLPMAETDDGYAARYDEIRALAQQAEKSGFDSVWLMDHFLFRHPGQPTRGVWEAWVMLAALAAVTQRVELGTLVLATSFRNPALLAKMAITLEEVSGGRLILGLGAGWHQPEYDAFGYPFDHRVDRFEEAMQIIAPLLRDGYVDFAGRYYNAKNCEIAPRGPRPHGPPILVGSSGPRMLGILARYADQWNTCWLGRPEHTNLAERQAALAAACRTAGRDPASVAVTVGVRVAGPDYTGNDDPATLLAGSPTDIAAALRAYAALGVAHVICWPQPNTTASVALLAEALQRYRNAD